MQSGGARLGVGLLHDLAGVDPLAGVREKPVLLLRPRRLAVDTWGETQTSDIQPAARQSQMPTGDAGQKMSADGDKS